MIIFLVIFLVAKEVFHLEVLAHHHEHDIDMATVILLGWQMRLHKETTIISSRVFTDRIPRSALVTALIPMGSAQAATAIQASMESLIKLLVAFPMSLMPSALIIITNSLIISNSLALIINNNLTPPILLERATINNISGDTDSSITTSIGGDGTTDPLVLVVDRIPDIAIVATLEIIIRTQILHPSVLAQAEVVVRATVTVVHPMEAIITTPDIATAQPTIVLREQIIQNQNTNRSSTTNQSQNNNPNTSYSYS